MGPKTVQKRARNEGSSSSLGPDSKKVFTVKDDPDASHDLWTTKYAPHSYDELIGNKTIVDKLLVWLRAWEHNRKLDFDKKKCGDLAFRAVLISGPPGIGKTTAAHLIADKEGYKSVEFNASDARNKNALDEVVMEATKTHDIREFFSMGKKPAATKHKSLIIMDEVDGMSSGDRGGAGELVTIIKKSKVPIICICNDRQANSVKTLSNHCLDLRFRRPTAQQAEKGLKRILNGEKLTLEPTVMAELIQSTHGDLRQIINVLSTVKLKDNSLTVAKSQQISKEWNKDTVMSSFDVCAKLLGSSNQNVDFRTKYEMFFYDYSLIPLMVQENYIIVEPMLAQHASQGNARRLQLEHLRCFQMASDYISVGDLLQTTCDQTQNWSILPSVAVVSTVAPSFFTHGSCRSRHNFASWLGQNSKARKGQRLLRDIQQHMRLKVTGNSKDIRLDYLDDIGRRLLVPLNSGDLKSPIEFMDEYYLNMDDFDAISGDLLFLSEKTTDGHKTFSTLMQYDTIKTPKIKNDFRKLYREVSHPSTSSVMDVTEKVFTKKGKAKKGKQLNLKDLSDSEPGNVETLEEETEELIDF